MRNKISNKTAKISVIGAGAWGSAIANLLADNGNLVNIFVKEKSAAQEINQNHKSFKLPGIKLLDNIFATDDFKVSVEDSDFIFIVVPSIAVEQIIKKLAQNKISSSAVLVLCSKGIEEKSGKLFSQIIAENLENNYAILSGPNFANEVALKLPTTTTIASSNKSAAQKITKLLQNNYFLPQISNDVITTQIAGAIKNILAIGCGIIEELKLGENAKAALLNQGINEITILAKKMGGKAHGLLTPAGFGDLFLTCSSKKSRNNSLGILIGQGKNPGEIMADQNKVYEGAKAAKSIVKLAKNHKINLPVCFAINKILYQNKAQNIKEIIHQSIFSQ
jgi:glycerol-3-phosphate dehydrogenase (NAD(P)+)